MHHHHANRTPKLRITETTAVAVEPITKADCYNQLRIDGLADDPSLDLYITSARLAVEKYTGRYLAARDFLAYLPHFPGAPGVWWDGWREGPETWLNGDSNADIILPRAPITAIGDITTYDSTTAENAVVIDPATYQASLADPNQRTRIRLRFGQVWPPTILRTIDGVSIAFTAGYDPGTIPIPFDLKLALVQLVAEYYSHRGDGAPITGSVAYPILQSYKLNLL